MSSIPIPPMPKNILSGADSQNVDEEDRLEYMEMPTEMSIFDIDSKVYDWDESHDLSACQMFLQNIYKKMEKHKVENDNLVFKIADLDTNNLGYLNALLSEGEVSAVITQKHKVVNIQESIFTGVWRITVVDKNKILLEDYIEVGDIPNIVRDLNQVLPSKVLYDSALLPENVANAPAILTELKDKRSRYELNPKLIPEAINLTLLPHTTEDIECINNTLGIGNTVLLSRGYGNCRISSTGVSSVWCVQYFNSTDIEILSTIEVVDIPIVACAAQEDLEDSAERLKEFSDEL